MINSKISQYLLNPDFTEILGNQNFTAAKEYSDLLKWSEKSDREFINPKVVSDDEITSVKNSVETIFSLDSEIQCELTAETSFVASQLAEPQDIAINFDINNAEIFKDNSLTVLTTEEVLKNFEDIPEALKFINSVNHVQKNFCAYVNDENDPDLNYSSILFNLKTQYKNIDPKSIPIITNKAFEVLQLSDCSWQSGLEYSLMPIGFNIKKFSKELIIKVTASPTKKSLKNLNDYPIFNWDQDDYDRLIGEHKRNIIDEDDINKHIKALFKLDPFEFNSNDVTKNSDCFRRININSFEANDNGFDHLNIITDLMKEKQYFIINKEIDNEAILSLAKYLNIVKSTNIKLYDVLVERFFSDSESHYSTDYSYLITNEVFKYLKIYCQLAMIAKMNVDNNDEVSVDQIKISRSKLKFCIAIFNSMDKSNFVQISRAINGFFKVFDKITDFKNYNNGETKNDKTKFYELLVHKTISDKKLKLMASNGIAQIELYRLAVILFKASESPELLKLQIDLLSDDLGKTRAVSIGPYSDFACVENVQFNSKGNILSQSTLIDPLFNRSFEGNISKETVLESKNYDDTKLLRLLIENLKSNDNFFGEIELANKVLTYKIIRNILIKLYDLTSLGLNKTLIKKFRRICKKHLKNSLGFDESIMKISTWLEDMLASNSDFKDTINQVLETTQLGDSFEEIAYNYYSQNYFQIFESRNITNIISDNLSLRVYDKILKKIKGLHNKSLFKHSHIITISNKFFALAVHDKSSKEINEKAIIKDIERYQKVWISCEKIKDKMHNRGSENYGDDNLEKLFGNISGEIFTIFNIDQNEDIESNISNIDLEKSIECEKFIIDSRFLAIRVLFDFLDDDLAIESELLNHIDVINDWIDTRDLTSQTSYFTNADYSVFSKEINQIELSEVSKIYRLLDNTFTNIKCKITDQYSFINILNLNDRIDCELPIYIDPCKQYSFKKFIKILKNELSSVRDINKKKILYNAIYLKIYDTIKFKESLNEILSNSPYRTIDEVTYIICNSYFNFIENKNQIEFDLIINIKNVEGDILNHIGYVMPVIKNSDNSFLKTFILFKNIYKQHINSFWQEIKNFTHILDSNENIKFLEDEHRNVSAKNLYDAMLVMFRNSIDQEINLDRHFLQNFHQYLNEILRSAIGIQNYHRFNFSYIINTALSIFEITHVESKPFSIKGKEKEDSEFNLLIDQNLSNANLAINLFNELCKISNACCDGLIWKYTFHISQIIDFKRKKQIFDNIFNVLIKCNLEFQKLIYILESNLNNNCLEIFEIILNSIDKKNSTFLIEIINILIGDSISTNDVFDLDDVENVIWEVSKIIENLDHLNFTLLKNYLSNSSSNKFTAFKTLIDNDQLDFTKCTEQIKNLRINNRYSISDENIKSHINNIEFSKDFDKSVLKKYISEVYEYLIDLANFNDEEFLKSLNLFDKTEAIDLKLIAHIIDAVYRTNDIVLRPVQISAFLLSIIDEGNVFNRMSAGEGKSAVNWVIGAYKVLTENISYVIVTANDELSSLQAKNSNSFFKFLGIPSNINPITPQTDFNEYCKYNVNFATLNNHILFKRLNQVRGNKLSKDIILGLDEADEPRDSHIPIRLSILDSINNYDHNKAFFKLINNFVDLGITNNEQKVFYYKVIKNLDDQESDGKNLTEFCSRKCKSIAATLLESNNNEDINKLKNKFKVYQSLYNNIKKMDFKLIFRLLKSAFESAEAAKNWIEGKNYSESVSYALINKGPLAKIVRIINIRPLIGGKFDPSDVNTKFSYGLAQCIATRWNSANKHNLANFNIHYHIDPLSINITFDTTQNIIHGGIKRTYKQVIAFSATAGNDQEVSSMIDKQRFNYISYPKHNENKIGPIFQNFSSASFNNSSRARRDGYLTWLARNDREKIHYLVEVLMQRVENGRVNPCVILCNNLQDVYELQAKLEIIIQQNSILRRLIMGVQTAGYKTIPTLDSENGELYSIDERHYLNILKKFHIDDDKLIPLNQKIVEQASQPGVITIGTLKTEGRGVDFFNKNRGLTVIVYGCDKDTISWTTFEQAIRRGRCINNSIAGLILTRQEIKQNLGFFNVNVDENKIISSHFYNLLDLIATANIEEIDKDRSFKQVWEEIQEHVINYDFENQEIKISILSNLLTNLKNMWDMSNYNMSCEDLWQEAKEILNNEGLSNILPNQSKFLDDYKFYDDVPFIQQHPFIECSVQENYFLKALNAPHKLVGDFKRNYLSFLIHKVTGIPLYDRERLNNYAESCLKISFAFLIMAVGAKSNFLKFKNPLLANISTGFIGGITYGLIFQDSIASDKKEHLDTWGYSYTATSATVAISSVAGILYATNITIVNCKKHYLFNNTFLKNVPCSKTIQVLFSMTYDCLSLMIFVKIDNNIKEKVLDYLDSKAIYNIPSSFELN